ncbi:hypothetical protein BDV12DRAFT_168747 [Aspergillus spectabilis]
MRLCAPSDHGMSSKPIFSPCRALLLVLSSSTSYSMRKPHRGLIVLLIILHLHAKAAITSNQPNRRTRHERH